jgi:hypothetical protein
MQPDIVAVARSVSSPAMVVGERLKLFTVSLVHCAWLTAVRVRKRTKERTERNAGFIDASE